MKKLLIIILISLTGANMNLFSQENNPVFSVSIDSVKMTGENINDKVLHFYITIKNHSSQNIEFHQKPIYMSVNKKNKDWNLILKKDNEIQVEWDDSRYTGDHKDPVTKFIVEKNTEFQKIFPIQLSSILVSGSRDNLSGSYTGQIILSTAKSEVNPRQSASSNIINFNIE